MTTRVCARCKVEKSFSEFHKDAKKKNGIRYTCKTCNKSRLVKYDSSEAGKKRMRISHWKRQNIDITHDKYVEMYNSLNGKCQICNKFFETLCVDHNHQTGKIRGLLCKQCNVGISALKEDKNIFNQAINYLERCV